MKKLLRGITAAGFAILAFSVAGSTSWAQVIVPAKVKPFGIAVGTQRTPRTAAIRISIQDAKAKSGVCPYYVRSFEYLPAANLISIEVFQENCVNEAFGFSQGEALWVAPQGLLVKGTKISVLVNQSLAGTLNYDDETQSFNANGD